jgi:hypothetical protein
MLQSTPNSVFFFLAVKQVRDFDSAYPVPNAMLMWSHVLMGSLSTE